jgi:disulfide bond formation protein DsbB
MKRWISDLSTTNFRIVISLGLAVLLVVVVLGGVVLRIEMQSEIIWALFAFVAGMLGIDVTQFSIKRKTEIVTPPQVTAENAIATITATAPPNPTPIPPIAPANPPVADPDPDRK